MLEINKTASEIHVENTAKGFWKERIEVPQKMRDSGLFTETEIAFAEHNIKSQVLLHIVCEIGEAEEAMRKDKYANLLAFGEAYAKSGDVVAPFETFIKDTYEDELADAVIRLFDLIAAEGIEIEQHIILKRLYNQTRPYKHGKNS
ncbi:hypothetical protein LZZ85_11280 [Terrimonas sp. NA20]|uniref:Uncharacterized protein n=1 Tax=Terrimonas ginsenosidimutans TaxID=2908004 RepID=A0ABS9KRB1_9BACT|nr:hypothetical protein [Terrimonas ginsenosidimutans]MCG2614870.1 hypothetical protein [Terrimonas ginsenosidimutans]